MKKFLWPSLALGLLAVSLNAGTAIIDGSASINTEPQYVEVSFSVQSQCYESRAALSLAHKQVVVNLQKRIGIWIQEENDFNGVKTNENFSGPYSHTIYNSDGKPQSVCQNTFQKTTTVTFKTDRLSEISEIFDGLNNIAADVTEGLQGNASSPSTSISLSNPTSKICQAKRRELEKQVWQLTRLNAQENFEALFLSSNIDWNTVQIIKTNSPASVSYRDHGYSRSAAFEVEAPVQISLDQIEISLTHQFKFKFDGVFPFAQCE